MLAAGGAMGADLAGTAITEAVAESTAADTRAAAIALADAGVDLLLFAGGDGTAVDVLAAVGDRLPVIGIPAGVKMHSAVFGVTPRSAGALAAAFVAGRVRGDAPGEVMDVEESDLRDGLISPRLHGFLRVPVAPGLVQGGKARSAPAEAAAQAAVAAHAVELLLDGATALIGPGTTTRAMMAALGLPKTVLGVDVVQGGRLLAADADEQTLLAPRRAGRDHHRHPGGRSGVRARAREPADLAARCCGQSASIGCTSSRPRRSSRRSAGGRCSSTRATRSSTRHSPATGASSPATGTKRSTA